MSPDELSVVVAGRGFFCLFKKWEKIFFKNIDKILDKNLVKVYYIDVNEIAYSDFKTNWLLFYL